MMVIQIAGTVDVKSRRKNENSTNLTIKKELCEEYICKFCLSCCQMHPVSTWLRIFINFVDNYTQKCEGCTKVYVGKGNGYIYVPQQVENGIAIHDWWCYIIAGIVSFRMRERHVLSERHTSPMYASISRT